MATITVNAVYSAFRQNRVSAKSIPPEYRLVLEMRDLAGLDTAETSR